MSIRIKPEQARIGMYVQGFAGNWLSHPFWRAHFVIASDDDLLRVRNSGTDIFIDAAKGFTGSSTESQPAQDAILVTKAAPGIRQMPSVASTPTRPKRPSRRIVPPPAFGKADEARAAALAQRTINDADLAKRLLLSMALTRENPRSAPDTLPGPGFALPEGFFWAHYPPLEKGMIELSIYGFLNSFITLNSYLNTFYLSSSPCSLEG